jgi:nitroimidazol reductase NimA-like FMN-containing flavoprotein (pyridoxamine 5'-phosphate oxidase superfamily)
MQADEDEALKDKLEATERTRLRRFPVRGQFDRVTINSILDITPIGHIGFNHSGPAVLPMVFWRTGNHVYFHGSAKNRMFNALANVRQCCFVATRIDAFVLARAALHHSVNYRSVVIYGEAQEVCEPELKLDALKTLIGRFYPGRWERIRAPSPGEFAAVRVFRLPIEEVSAKIRSGFPTPYAEDFGIPVWAGVVPLELRLGEPRRDPNGRANETPEDLTQLALALGISADAAP